ncbi:MAG: DinB family protein, partial [Calditrichaeota bacterium]
MTQIEMLQQEFEQELAATRRTLERLDDQKWNWKPHPRSWSLGELANHLVNLLSWFEVTLGRDELDLSPSDESPARPVGNNRQEILSLFDQNARQAGQLLSQTREEHLWTPWKLLKGGQELFTMPRILVLRRFVLNHLVHHRGQL